MKRTRLKRSRVRKTAKKGSIGWFKKKLWTIFSKYIRQRDGYTCITCNKKGKGSQIHAGHFIPRASGGLSLYFHEDNVHAQCYRCNINLGGNGGVYYQKLLERKGQEVIDNLFFLKDNGYLKLSIEDYKKLIEEYKNKIKELENGKKDLPL